MGYLLSFDLISKKAHIYCKQAAELVLANRLTEATVFIKKTLDSIFDLLDSY